jgi:NCS1 family nucleobase:cation symporter-1
MAEPLLEVHSIEQIPPSERHGRPWTLFTLWFASNVQVNGLVTGAVAIAVGLNLELAILAVVVGNLVGALFMAYHSAQGPKLGLPQMIQSRAQFGYFGAILPFAIVVLMYLGFAVEGGVVAGQAIAGWLGISKDLGIVIFNVVLLVIALVGYQLIHDVSKGISVLSAIVFVALAIELGAHLPAHFKGSSDTLGTFLLAVSVCASWQITWAPYVSDYSRYLPEDTSTAKTFWYTYLASGLGGALIMVLGAMAAAVNSSALNANAIGFLGDRFPAISGLMILILLVSLVPAGAEGPYGAFLTALSSVFASGHELRSTPRARAIFVIAFTVIATVLAVASSGNLLGTFENITLFLLYLLVPWTAINLTDFYLVRKGRYDIDALLARSGRYGAFNTGAVAIFVITILLEIPFVNSSLYVGPLVSHLGGADISWIVGLVFASVAYYLYATRRHEVQAA